MWDNPRLLNLVAGALVGLALLALVVATGVLFVRSPLFPVTQIELAQRPERTSIADIETALRGRIRGNFFSVSTAEVRAALEQLPWVRKVSVRRIWPDRLRVSLEERVPLARWGDDALVDAYGERFQARIEGALPLFVGPVGTEREVTQRYARFAAAVVPLGTKVEQVVLSARYAWQLKLANGLRIMLGRDGDAAELRLRRFVAAYPGTVEGLSSRLEYVDLRYPNGFALRVAEMKG